MYLGSVLQNMLRGYTEAAVGFTTGLLTLISRFAVQVSAFSLMSEWGKSAPTFSRRGATTGTSVNNPPLQIVDVF